MGELTLVGTLTGERVALRPVAPDDLPALMHILNTPEVRKWCDVTELGPGWPGSDDGGPVRFTILRGRRIAGLIQYWENDDPGNRHAGMKLFLDPHLHGRGLGRDAVRTLARHLFDDRGHHRIVVRPAATNEFAIRCCAAVGFRTVGAIPSGSRRAMDLLSTEIR